MPIMSDKWINEHSGQSTHRLHCLNGIPSKLIGKPYSREELAAINNWNEEHEQQRLLNNAYAIPLSKEEQLAVRMISNYVQHPVRYVDKETGQPVIVPVGEEPPATARRVISFGLTSYGYDVRLDNDPEHIVVFTTNEELEIDPKRIKPSNFFKPPIKVDEEGAQYVMIPPHSYLQGPTVEYFNIPRDILVIVLGKSTLARSGLVVNVTPIEPGFVGTVVMEIGNLTASPVRCYLHEGLAQFCFLQGNEPCAVSYADKGGKYMGQQGMVFAKV